MNEEQMRQRIHDLKAENEKLRDKLNQHKRTLGGTNAALTRAHDKVRRLEDELAALKLRLAELEGRDG